MAMKGHQAGGGIASNKVVEVKQNLGQSRRGVTPGYVSQLGNKVGDHYTNAPGGSTNYRGEKFHDGRTGISVPLGNEVAARTVCGPGGSREVMRSGSQGMQGSPAPGNPPPSGELFPGWPAPKR
jgi:hypothetical protein